MEIEVAVFFGPVFVLVEFELDLQICVRILQRER